MLKACRRGRYRTINAIASIAARLRSQRTAGEVAVRLIDAVLEELRWALENPNFRDQQRVITYARLLGELYETNQVSGHLLIRQLFDFINLGHEVSDGLREASKKLASEVSHNGDPGATNLPVYNSATGVSQTILEDEEMDDDALVTKESPVPESFKPVAVSEHSKYDPRVPSHTDPPNSAFRIKLVCTLLEVAAPIVVTRSNIPRLKGFLTAFQRYLFTKSILPTDVEFALLDTFDVLDSHWKQVTKSKKGAESEDGFPRFATWLDAHNATVAYEESEALLMSRRADLNDASDVKSTTYSVDGRSARDDDDTMTNFDEEEVDEDDESLQSHFDSEEGNDDAENQNESLGAADEMEVDDEEPSSDADDDEEVTSEEDEEGNSESEYDSDEGEDEEEFDEEGYMRKLEEEAFEQELRRMTLDAIERGKNTSRKLVADSMPSGSQITRKKGPDPTPAESVEPPPVMLALSGKEGVSFQVLKKGNKGKVETRDLVVPKDTNLAVAASRKGDEAARERDVIKQRVLQYEAESAYAEESGGNVYLEQEKLQVIRNRPLSLEDIDRNFGTTAGNLRQGAQEKASASQSTSAGGRSANVPAAGRRPGRGRDGGAGRGRGRVSSGRTLY
jgi:regulator of nonsense transcripts 2